MMVRTKLLGLILLGLLVSCAQQTSPTGGPKDETAPVLIQSTPVANQLNYKDKTVTLVFDEVVIISNPKEQIIITPDIGPDYEIVAKKNKVILTMKEPLKDSTTYAFNFGESVQDITEKNPADNLHIAFSTGNTIDSLSISGNVYDLLSGKAVEKTVVAIYQNPDTFNIYNHKPSYITRTLKDGTFQIGNLKAGIYYLYAYLDKNRNLTVDSKSERYGFLIHPISLTKDTTKISIPISPMDATDLKITRARPFNNYFTINLSKNIIDYTLVNVETLDTIISSFGENYSNIITRNTTNNTDSIHAKLNAFDSIGNTMDTTFYIKYSSREVTPEKFTVSNQNPYIFVDKGKLETSFKINKPIKWATLDSLIVYIDSTTQLHFTPADLAFDSKKLTIKASLSLDPTLFDIPPEPVPVKKDSSAIIKNTEPLTLEQRANMQIGQKQKAQPKNLIKQGQGAFISVDNDSSVNTNYNIKLLKATDLAIIFVNITTTENFIVNLLSKDFQVIKTSQNNSTIKFEDLLPGDYQIQLIIDKNKNGKWDAGNYQLNIEPEPIIFYTSEKDIQIIPARANFEIGPLLITY